MKLSSLGTLGGSARWLFSFKLTMLARHLAAGTFAAWLMTVATPYFALPMALTIVLILAGIVNLIFRPRVLVKGNLPARVMAGKEFSFRCEIINPGRMSFYDLGLGCFGLPREVEQLHRERLAGCLAGGGSVEMQVHLRSLRRGQYQIGGPRCFTTFPLNLFRSGRRAVCKHSLLVLPSFPQLNNLSLPMQKRYQPGGITLASNVGESAEYIGNREYRAGDSPRRIDTRAWARLACPAVKEYQQEYFCHVAIVMDTFIPRRRRAGKEGFAELEGAVSLTAALSDFMSRGEEIIDFFAAGPELYSFRYGRHTSQLDTLLEILACIGPSRENPFVKIAPVLFDELAVTSAVVFVLLDWDEYRKKLIRRAVESGCDVRVFIIRDKAASLDYESDQSWAGEITVLKPSQIREGELSGL